MPLFFLGTREWRNRQTRTVQVRVPVMEWGFNSPLAHDETADPSGSAVFVFPGCCLWRRWCSGRRRARPPARLGPHFVRRRASKPARALRSLRRPPHQWGRAALCACGRRPAREPSVLRAFGSARRREARPGPAAAHGHRSLARCFLWASRGSRVLSFWGAWVRVVTNVVNPRAFSLKMVVFWPRLTTFVTGVLAR